MTSRTFLLAFVVIGLGFRMARLVFVIRNSKSRDTGRVTARPIFWIMTMTYLIYIAFCSHEGLGHGHRFSWGVSGLGLFLYAGALSLRELAMRDLGRFFSPDIEIRQGHRVVREGLYRHMRHPLLACMGLEILGLGLVFNAYLSLLWVGLGFYLPLILIRKTLEERTLLEVLGESYKQYQREVGAFWPHLSGFSNIKRGVRHG